MARRTIQREYSFCEIFLFFRLLGFSTKVLGLWAINCRQWCRNCIFHECRNVLRKKNFLLRKFFLSLTWKTGDVSLKKSTVLSMLISTCPESILILLQKKSSILSIFPKLNWIYWTFPANFSSGLSKVQFTCFLCKLNHF